MIRLVPFVQADSEELTGWVSSAEELFAWSGNTFTNPLDRKQLERHLEREGSHNRIFKALLESNGTPVGHVQLYLGERQCGSGTICRLLVAPNRRRGGIGTSIVTALLELAFGELGLRRVDLRAFAESDGVLPFYQRLGFVPVGVQPDARRFRGEYRSLVVMGLEESEWRARQAEPIAS